MSEKALTTIKPLPAPTQIKWTKQEVDIIRETLAGELTEPQFRVFMASAKALNLNPLAKQICPVLYKGKMSLQTEIDGYRTIADRTGNYGGSENARLFVKTKDDMIVTVALEEYYPDYHVELISATIEVRFKDGTPNQSATALFRSYAPYFNGKLGHMWEKMPEHMLLKCAEALALRKAFPGSYEGVYVKEEMEQAAVDVQFSPVDRAQLNTDDLKPGRPEDHSDVTEAPGPPPAEDGQKPLTDSDKAEIRFDEICDEALPIEISEYFEKKAVAKAMVMSHYRVTSADQFSESQLKGLAKYLKSMAFLDWCREERLIK